MHTLRTAGLLLTLLWILVYIAVYYGAWVWPRIPRGVRFWIVCKAHDCLLTLHPIAALIADGLLHSSERLDAEASRLAEPVTEDK